MSYTIMPTLPISMAGGIKKSPHYNTVVQKPAAGRGISTIALMAYPTWDFEFSLDKIQGNESAASSVFAQFYGVFMATLGGAGFFLFTDPQDHAVTDARFGTGDGSTKVFQLMRQIGGGGWDVVQNVNSLTNIKINGSTTAAYSIDSKGVVTFTSAPAADAVLTWTGSFYFLCRFSEDVVDGTRVFTTNSGTDLWDVSVKFESVLI